MRRSAAGATSGRDGPRAPRTWSAAPTIARPSSSATRSTRRLDALAADLSRARAEAVKNALVADGIPARRIIVHGKGADEPVADNGKPRGRLANRRVEIKLYVPPR